MGLVAETKNIFGPQCTHGCRESWQLRANGVCARGEWPHAGGL
ncbi:Uncharacterised protein [Mycobacteroides abscessus subsp. abscessus]|nr:Uncharacterised protein [Mycobacteroides abscessus subsp. abscessus]